MTVAICIKCGAKKVGALTPCRDCGFAPSTCEDQAKSIALSDHCMATEELHVVGLKIGEGEHPAYDEAFVRKMAQTIQQDPKATKMPLGCLIAIWTPIVIMVILVIAVVSLFVYTILNSL